MEQTSTQVLYWDTTENIVWGELDSTPQTLQTAEENIDAQARLRNTLGKEMTRVLIDMRQTVQITRETRNHYAGERTASIQRATALMIDSPLSATITNFFMGLNKPLARIIHEEADYSRKPNAPVWYKGCAHRPFATTEALA